MASWVRGAKLSHGTDIPAERLAIETDPRFVWIQELQAVGIDWKHVRKAFSVYDENAFSTSKPSDIVGCRFAGDFYFEHYLLSVEDFFL